MATKKNNADSGLERRKSTYEELTRILLKKANLSKADILDEALQRFVATNLDLLTPTERKKFDVVI
ncbi:MAG: hypothetical protein R3Y59_00835 [bacterium]